MDPQLHVSALFKILYFMNENYQEMDLDLGLLICARANFSVLD